MARGGTRKGAGRKPGVPNQITQDLRENIDAEALLGVLEEAALRGRLPKHEEKKTVYREISTKEQIDAITTLVKKVVPDRKAQEIKHEGDNPVVLITNYVPDKKYDED